MRKPVLWPPHRTNETTVRHHSIRTRIVRGYILCAPFLLFPFGMFGFPVLLRFFLLLLVFINVNPLLSSDDDDVVHQLNSWDSSWSSTFHLPSVRFPADSPFFRRPRCGVPPDGTIIIISIVIAGFLLCDPEQGTRVVLQHQLTAADGTFLGRVSRPRPR